jgi:tetraacyldisaccharide-1-P 4'-kinase
LIVLSGRGEVANTSECVSKVRGSGKPTMHFRYTLDSIRKVGFDQKLSPYELKGKKMLLFSGIGNHESFASQMSRSGIDIAGEMKFPDHHTYSERDLKEILASASRAGADCLLTTEKDFARLSGNKALLDSFALKSEIFIAGIKVDIIEGGQNLDMLINRCLTQMGIA